MSNASPLPAKEDVAKRIAQLATTISDQMQTAALGKARELGFDLNKGRLSLEETLINLTRSRDLLIDAAEKGKLSQLPLKLQYTLFTHAQRLSDTLTSLVNGTDAIQTLEEEVEDLTATIWQYNLYNLSGDVLDFHNKMNQLKAQETLIRQVHREAEDFASSRERANQLLQDIEAAYTTSKERAESALSQLTSNAAQTVEQEQKIAALLAQAQQHDATTAQHEANAKAASAAVQAIAPQVQALQAEAETTKVSLNQFFAGAQDTLATLRREYDQLKADNAVLVENFSGNFSRDARASVEDAVQTLKQRTAEMESSVKGYTGEATTRLDEMRSDHEKLQKHYDDAFEKFSRSAETIVTGLEERATAVLANTENDNERLVAKLSELEEQIKTAIEKATGFTLFHAFQRRQVDLARSKWFWGWALAAAVVASLVASGVFIWSLRWVHEYNAAFYLKLSISLPLLYAVVFCSIQYSRERRLEEEYAFKSTISISLDPYRELVGKLVNIEDPGERAKYTAFVIESVGRVFTSPTEKIFEDHSKDSNSAEGIIKAIGDLVGKIVKK